MKIYLIWDHLEDGPKDLKATDNKDKVIGMVDRSGYLDDDYLARVNMTRPEIIELVNGIISKGEPDIYSLFGGWGALHLQIVETE